MFPLFRKISLIVLTCTSLCMCTHADTSTAPAPRSGERPVVLDIGHQNTAGGAQTPDGKLNEFAFWCRYAGEVKQVIEQAGYPCVILNRGNAPAKGTSAEAAKAAAQA